MDEQGGAAGVPPHDGHRTTRSVRPAPRRGEERTAAADTDEASRLDRPAPEPNPTTGRRRWAGPKSREDEEK
ncbi:hypothetical protein [Streptomyces sp. NBC_00503]|uniref:hypothetical protein n=1 Tax=Streptomyces sp. NBC_00503 TaxID=2903659 RepID=UPI002E8052E1|nr:hypothetical protein [Streptomyces sp. NBC_00503]WUD79215.1 hypothetical protein OG490_00705 [Streptomyces sp. NBC_00503]